MDEDVIIPCILCSIWAFVIGLTIGLCCVDTEELSNGCIVYDNNIYCVEEANK